MIPIVVWINYYWLAFLSVCNFLFFKEKRWSKWTNLSTIKHIFYKLRHGHPWARYKILKWILFNDSYKSLNYNDFFITNLNNPHPHPSTPPPPHISLTMCAFQQHNLWQKIINYTHKTVSYKNLSRSDC